MTQEVHKPVAWVTKGSTETYEKEPERVYTKQERIRNWWDYHTGWVVFGIVVLIMAIFLIRDMFFRPRPDYDVGYVSVDPLPEEVLTALRDRLQEMGEDVNGDGRVIVEILSYSMGFDEQSLLDVDAVSSGMTRLTGDLMSGDLYVMLLTDPEGFQRRMGSLCYLDGHNPASDDETAEAENWRQMVYRWEDCPVLANLDLGTYTSFWDTEKDTPIDGQSAMQGVYVARCGIWNEDQRAVAEKDELLWQALTAGAKAP